MDAAPAPRAGTITLLSVTAPVFNESGVIRGVVEDWRGSLGRLGIPAEIVLCDDGSTDGTGEILDDLRARYPEVRVVGDGKNHGYGHAMCAAIQATRGDYVVTIDSDGQFSLDDLPEMIRVMKEHDADAVTGSRPRKRDNPVRIIADRGLNLIVRVLFRTNLRDTNCALKIIRGDLLRSMILDSAGFSFPTEVCVKLEARNVRVYESPIRHVPRNQGESKLKVGRTAWRMFWFLIYLRLRLYLSRHGSVTRF